MRLIPFFMAMLMMAACGVDESEPALPADIPAETPAPLAPPPALALPNGDKIDVEQLSGPAPFTVQIIGNNPLATREDACVTQLRFASHGIGVSWGDGTASPTDWALPDGEQGHCQRIDRHTYSLPGTYTITGRTWGVGAADQIIPMWQGQQTITVTKGVSLRDTSVRLNGLMDGKTIGSWPGSLRWHQELSEPMALSFRLSTGGEKIAVMSKPVTAFTGYDGWPLRPDTEGAVRLEAAYKAGDGVAPLELTITGTSPSGEVVYKRQLNFKSDKNTKPVFHGCPGTYPTSPGGLTYTMRKGMNLNAPWMIDIDWYDGSKMYAYGPGNGADKAELPEGAELTGKMIDELHSEVAFTHTFAKPGTYKIRFSASNNTPENPPYSGNYCSLSYNAGLN